jgi:hypothetical protein
MGEFRVFYWFHFFSFYYYYFCSENGTILKVFFWLWSMLAEQNGSLGLTTTGRTKITSLH